MRSAVVAAVLCQASLVAAQIPSIPGFPKSRRERQSDAAQKLYPAAIELAPPGVTLAPPNGEPRPIRVRVYAARDYRDQTFNWSAKFRRLVERVNKTVRRWPAVRFELVEVKSWERDSSTQPMGALLDELEKLDAGRDVDLVIGLIAAVPVLPTQIHNLGMARAPGRHIVLRSLHDLAELEALRRCYDELPDAERDRLLSERKTQKEQVVFLHEWAHTLGAIHALHSDLIMNPTADAQQSRFCAPNAHLIETALRYRLGGGDDRAMRKELADYIQSARFEEWDVKDREQMLGFISNGTSIAAPAPPPRSDGNKLSEVDQAVYNKTLEYHKARDWESGWKTLEPLIAKYPMSAPVQLVACELTWRRAVGQTRWRAVEPPCRAAARLAPEDPGPQLLLADVYVEAHLDDKAPTAITQAHQRLDYRPGAPIAEWQLLASLYQRAQAPAHAVQVAARAGDDMARSVGKWAEWLRRRDGLPAGALPADRESAFVRAFDLASTAIEGGQKEAARILVENVEREFAAVPGASVLRCQLELSRNQLREAEAACTRALAAQDDAVAAHFYLGAMPARAPSKAAVAHLKRAVELDPTLEPAWRLLAHAYRATRDRAALDGLRADYEKQFHSPLP